MATYMMLTPDANFKNKDNHSHKSESPNFVKNNGSNKFDHVRRPIRGTQFKGESFATLEIKTKDGKNLLMLDSGGQVELDGVGYSSKYSNFLLTGVQESRMERSQIMETFGPSYIFFFGERPTVVTFSGMLLNSADFNWKNEFWENYDRYLRGTQCVTYATKAYISYDDVMKQGYILSASTNQMADPDQTVEFSFQMIIANHINLSSVGNPDFPINPLFDGQVDIILDTTDETVDNQLVGQKAGNTKYGKIRDNDDEYIVRNSKPVNMGNLNNIQYQKQTPLEDLVRKWYVDHGMTPPGAPGLRNGVNLDNIGGSGVSLNQIKGWAGGATFTVLNILREGNVGLDKKDANASDNIAKAKQGGSAARFARLP
jgi:hypothetical protein